MKLIQASTIKPTEFNVLLRPEKVEEVTAGGIILPDMTQDSKKYAETKGEIVAISSLAFSYASPEEWAGNEPKVGQIALYAKFAGVHVKCDDGEYLIVKDKDIVAIIKE